MMLLIALALSLIIGTLIAIGIQRDQGYVMLEYQDWVVETNLAVLMVFFIIIFLIGHHLLQFLITTRNVPSRIKKFQGQRKVKNTQKALDKSTALMLEGKWPEAEWEAVRLIEHSDAPLAHNLLAARAAFHQGAMDRCQKYLEAAAINKRGKAKFSADITHAELLLGSGDSRKALVILQPLEKKYAKNLKLLHLLKSVYLQEEDWERLLETVHVLDKKEAIDTEEKTDLEQNAYQHLMAFSAQEQTSTAIRLLWKRMPSHLKKSEEVVCQYVNDLISFDEEQEAEVVLAQALKHVWMPNLLMIYSRFKSNYALHLEVLEGWLKLHGADALLLRVAGSLAVSDGQWEKARQYLELSLDIEEHAEACHYLGLTMESLGEPEEAMRLLKKGYLLNSRLPLSLPSP